MIKIFRQSSKTRGKIYTQTLCHLSLLLKKPILTVLPHTQWSSIGNAPPYLFAFFTLIICLPMNHSWGFHTRSIQADKMTLKQTLLQHFYSNSEHPFTNILNFETYFINYYLGRSRTRNYFCKSKLSHRINLSINWKKIAIFYNYFLQFLATSLPSNLDAHNSQFSHLTEVHDHNCRSVPFNILFTFSFPIRSSSRQKVYKVFAILATVGNPNTCIYLEKLAIFCGFLRFWLNRFKNMKF